MNVLLIPNFQKEYAADCLLEVLDRLSELGIGAYLDQACAAHLRTQRAVFCDMIDALSHVDLIIAIGGDGTMIHAAKHAVKHNLPVLGINAGRMGFLAQIERGHLEDLDRLVDQNYEVCRRLMIEAQVMTDSGPRVCVALNDIVLTKADLSRIVDIEVICNGRSVSEYHADGVIFSTPTGSTAYALSAGGPVVDPGIDCIAMTPICPHSLFARAVVFSPEKVLVARAKYINAQNGLYLSADGEKPVKVRRDTPVIIRRSKLCARLVDFGDREFYEVLNEKILGRGRENEV